jgi:membrane associated rhomboid family serine protease
MGGLLAIWLMFAIALNWGGASLELFLLFCGNTDAILSGELWRLVTAPAMHFPKDRIGDIVFSLLGLYFLTPTLEQHWGRARLLRFLVFSGVIAYGSQLLVGLVLPAELAAKLIPEHWFGFGPVLEAIAIAWALSFRDQELRLFFVFPMKARTLVWFVIGISVLRVIAVAGGPEGLISPFGGMFAGWLLGGSTPSPLRRAFLRLRLVQLERGAAREKRARSSAGRNFEVIRGGRAETPQKSTDKKKNGRGPDGQWLN